MNILALDLGQNCGWALHCDGKIKSGVWSLKPTKFDSHGQRFLLLKRHLEIEIIIGGVEKVFFESVRKHIGTDAAHAYGAYMGVLQTTCLENDIPYEGVPVQTIKKHATGRGNADKQQMVDAAVQQFKSINVIDDNHADALHLLDYCLCNLTSQ